MKKNLGAVDLLDEARDFETQKLQNIYGAGMKIVLICVGEQHPHKICLRPE